MQQEQKIKWNEKNVFMMHNVSHPCFFKCPVIADEKLLVSSIQPNPVMLSNFIPTMPPEFLEHNHDKIIIRNLLSGLKSIHERTYVLVSITPENIAIQYNKDHISAYFSDMFEAQWCPIGGSITLDQNQSLTPYHAPECHIKCVADATSDVYSVGALWISLKTQCIVDMSSDDDILSVHKTLVAKCPDTLVSDMMKFHGCERPPLAILYSMVLHGYGMEAFQESTRNVNAYNGIFQQLHSHDIAGAVTNFQIAANHFQTDPGLLFVIPTFLANIVHHFDASKGIMSGHSVMMLRDVARSFIDLLIFLQEHDLLKECNQTTFDHSKFSTVIILGCDYKRDAFIKVVKTFVGLNVFKLTREALLRFINAKINFDCLNALIEISDEEDLKSLCRLPNIDEHKKRNAELEKELETFRAKVAKIAELIT